MIEKLRGWWDDNTPQSKRASVIFIVSIVTYGLVYIATRGIIESRALSQTSTIALTAIQIVPFIGCLYGGRAVYLAADEMFQRTQARGMVWGFFLATAVTIPYGYFENIHVVPHFRADLVWIILGIGWIAGMSSENRRLS